MLLDGPKVVLGVLCRPGINAFGVLRWDRPPACRPGGAGPCCCLVGSRTRTYHSVRDGLVGVHRVCGRLRPAGASRGHDTRRRQALTIVDPAVLPDDIGSGGRRKELAVGPVKSTASSAILTLPPFAVQALRAHRRQQLRLRLASGQPATVGLRFVEPGRPPRPVELELVFLTERGTPVNPTTPAAPSLGWPPASGWPPTRTCCATRWRRRWRPTRSRPASSRRSCATPMAARSPSACTSTSSRRPRPGWPG